MSCFESIPLGHFQSHRPRKTIDSFTSLSQQVSRLWIPLGHQLFLSAEHGLDRPSLVLLEERRTKFESSSLRNTHEANDVVNIRIVISRTLD